MNWYEKLNQYFPIEEMKSKEHMETLLEEKGDIYHKDEGRNHVLMYVEDDRFVFVDYLFVSGNSRGQGLGRKLLDKLKQKGKPILLEVEPATEQDVDTEKRLRFYKREGFRHASSISYRRRSLATNEINEMEILFWANDHAEDEQIYECMKKTYEQIHIYKDETLYGKKYQLVEEVLKLNDCEEKRDILKVV
ncbi:N-acetyltransferase [Peribacillus cavernae]|uniref:N-acetyltransferase n=1 Tax=Peribacillus cavernae TaxID=1674310 RepID=A0A433HP93_9BACI|nr:GNAT family N-acetyltransferase [Peribacillus cavernae]MDQ0217520.1 GNAT superfamily N-acetyltransferase [Peribacillus cavernae]RUQ30042.1 N-acetyltransferase [Peribacillus cavernae]